jgi:hypothetical protein
MGFIPPRRRRIRHSDNLHPSRMAHPLLILLVDPPKTDDANSKGVHWH